MCVILFVAILCLSGAASCKRRPANPPPTKRKPTTSQFVGEWAWVTGHEDRFNGSPGLYVKLILQPDGMFGHSDMPGDSNVWLASQAMGEWQIQNNELFLHEPLEDFGNGARFKWTNFGYIIDDPSTPSGFGIYGDYFDPTNKVQLKYYGPLQAPTYPATTQEYIERRSEIYRAISPRSR